MRARLPVPAIVTYRSRGNDSTATRPAAGSTRKIMIVSLRSPTRPDSSSPNAGAYGELGSTQAPLSAPVMRKFLAVGSAGGNVGGAVVGGAVSAAVVVARGLGGRPGAAAGGRRAERDRRLRRPGW